MAPVTEQTPGEVLVSWNVRRPVPFVGGPNRRRRLPTPFPEPGQTETAVPSASSATGSDHDAPGQVIGTASTWTDARRTVVANLELARRYAERLRGDGITQVRLARDEGVSTARVSQVLALLRLDEAIRREIEHGGGPVPKLAALVSVSRAPASDQLAMYRALLDARWPRDGKRPRTGRSQGVQHTFATARRYQAELDSGRWRSVAEFARAEHVSATRMTALLDLLSLAPEILAAVDVPAGAMPAGVTQRGLLDLARCGDHAVQRGRFFGRMPSAAVAS